MSHFSEVKTRLQNKEIIIKALEKMGYTVTQSPQQSVEVTGFFDEKEKAEFKVSTHTRYDIGFRSNGDSYEVVGDWELLDHTGIKQEEFVQSVHREYSKQVILQVAEENGYDLNILETPEEQETTIEVSKW